MQSWMMAKAGRYWVEGLRKKDKELMDKDNRVVIAGGGLGI